jgi:Zn-dependent peptidase ImmA (M78 family)
MSILWEKFVGDTEQFGLRLSFPKDPDCGRGATLEESVSWGSFQLWVEGQNLCAHREEGESIESVHWYLLPLLKWLAGNWDALFHEERLPGSNAGQDSWSSLRATRFPPYGLREQQAESWEEEWQSWWQRHGLQSCRSGGLFPDVFVRRWRDLVEVSWGHSPVAGAPSHFRFLSPNGFARIKPEKIAEPLYDVIRSATDYLIGKDPVSQVLKQVREEIEAIRHTNRDRRLALLAGIGEQYEDRLEAWNRVRSYFPALSDEVAACLFGSNGSPLVLTGTCQAALMFGSVAPTISADDAMTLAGWLVRLYSSGGSDMPLEKLSRSESLDASDLRSWDQGYRLAEEFVQELGLLQAGAEWIDIEQIYDQLGVERDQVSLNDPNIRAVSMASPNHKSCSLLNVNHPTYGMYSGRRFTLAHELCHLLYDRSYGWQLAIASGPWAPHDLERRANAFAAMLRMPTDLVLRVVRSLTIPLNTLAAARQVASELRTSPTATIEHLGNFGLLDEADRERIRLEAERQLTSEEIEVPSS